MPGAECKGAARRAAQHEQVGILRRRDEPGHRMHVRPRPRFGGHARILRLHPCRVQQHLREFRLRVDVDAAPEARGVERGAPLVPAVPHLVRPLRPLQASLERCRAIEARDGGTASQLISQHLDLAFEDLTKMVLSTKSA